MLKGGFSLGKALSKSIHPRKPVRARFAPSPTGYLHLGSLRTALYNYLLARSTGGQFLLRLEDTDQKRLVPDAEERIYSDLKWLGLKYDEGPDVGGPCGPYRQSERGGIYAKYVDMLLSRGLAYKCYCSKERLEGLRESAKLLRPPTTVSYDRHCASKTGEGDFVVRFKSPERYPKFTDLLHGTLDLQPQINRADVRYDDFVIMKSDGLPTYHFANVVDDHLMEITHVIRGEEWLPSTPKHLALYEAFGWNAPAYIHLPLLTSAKDKKLSKRTGDIDVSRLRDQGYVAESLINFSVLYGWSPKRVHNEKMAEMYTLAELEKQFCLDGLTKGNAKVDFGKLNHFNKLYLEQKLQDPRYRAQVMTQIIEHGVDSFRAEKILALCETYLTKVGDIFEEHDYLFTRPVVEMSPEQKDVLKLFVESYNGDLDAAISHVALTHPRGLVFKTVRLAVSGRTHGIKLPALFDYFGHDEVVARLRSHM